MSDLEQETVADIVADVRERAENAMRNGERLVHNEAVANMLTFVADRIEAAWKRDEERAVEHATRHAEAVARDNCRDCVHNPSGKNYEGGNAAAMREALLFVKQYFDKIDPFNPNTYTFAQIEVDHIQDAISAALSEPPHNCDVGTVEEQLDRYGFYCQSRCTSCDERHYCHICGERYRMECMMKWAQMPLRGRREVDGSK